MTEPNYVCAQQDLYSGLETLWSNYAEDIADFTAYKAGYTLAKGTAAVAAVAAAKVLPDDDARSGVSEVLRTEVQTAADDVIGDFVKTKGYINGIVTKAARKATYGIAGQNYYRAATQDDWESVAGLGSSMIGYINANETVLEDGGENMPKDTFKASVEGHISIFAEKYLAFKDKKQTGVGTDDKIKANNACFTTGADMREDAQIIFRKDAEKAKRYDWTAIIDSINPTVSGMKGGVIDSNTDLGIAEATVSMKAEGKPAIETKTDAAGKYALTGIEADTYTVTISKIGFESVTEIIVVKKGTVSNRDWPLQRAV